jgi:hypothetical protein
MPKLKTANGKTDGARVHTSVELACVRAALSALNRL